MLDLITIVNMHELKSIQPGKYHRLSVSLVFKLRFPVPADIFTLGRECKCSRSTVTSGISELR